MRHHATLPFVVLAFVFSPAQPLNSGVPPSGEVRAERRSSNAPRSQLPPYVPGEVLVGLKEGGEIQAVLQDARVGARSVRRIRARWPAIEKFRRTHPFKRGTDGLFQIVGRKYADVEDVPEDVLFDQAYRVMSPRENALYRSYEVSVAPGMSVAEAIAAFLSSPGVEYAEPNYLVTITHFPDDPLYSEQWSHQNTEAEFGWDIERGDPSTVIAILDTGVDYPHEDLAANTWHDAFGNPGKDFVDIDTTAYILSGFALLSGEDYTEVDDNPSDFNGHGTHVAGIAGGVADNATGVAGVCHDCAIMPVRAGFSIEFDGTVYGLLESDDIVNGITYAADNGADVINMSIGMDLPSQEMENALDYAYFDKGVVLVAAAGNDSLDGSDFPAAFETVISVAATAIDDTKAWYSNFGFSVDVAAPGGDEFKDTRILSTVPLNGTHGDPSGYLTLQGTSMASPYVSGLAGLLLSKNPALDPRQVSLILRHGVDDPSSDQFIGIGRVNIRKALEVNAAPVAEAEILSPASGSSLQAGANEILGTATGTSYTLEIADQVYSGSWTLIASGTSVIDGTLGFLDTAILERNQVYFIKLTVSDSIDIVDIIAVSYGWPRFTNSPILGSPTVFDLDGDGTKEIILPTYGPWPDPYDSGSIHVWREDGSVFEGWPLVVAGPFPGSVAAGDLDNDGSVEIVASNRHAIYVLNHDATAVVGWPKPKYVYQSPVLVDLDGDATLEIILPADYAAGGGAKRIYAWHHDGSNVSGWPKEQEGASTAAVADLDGDGRPEVVVGTRGENDADAGTEAKAVYVWRADGTPLPGWPQNTIGWVKAPPVIGDLERDGDLEIVAQSGSGIYAWHHDGSVVAGWPLALEEPCINIPPIVSDIDQDGDLEILFCRGPISSNILVEAYHHDGTSVAGWPLSIPASAEVENGESARYVTGDIDGDRDIEVVVKGRDRLFAWHDDGTPVEGFPFDVDDQDNTGTVNPFPVIADLDNDGTVEIVVAANFDQIFVFDLPGEFSEAGIEWPMYQHDSANTGRRASRCGDGRLEPWEECDDGGESEDCDVDCTLPVCGDGTLNLAAGEACDDGNLEDGDCCSSTCVLEPEGSFCTDGSACTRLDSCVEGVCSGAEEPETGCRKPTAANRARLKLKDRSNDRGDSLTWYWRKGAETDLVDFGNPLTTTDYAICVYDEFRGSSRLVMDVKIPAGGTCASNQCWKKSGSKAYVYRDRPASNAQGIQKVVLKSGPEGKPKIVIKGRGEALDVPLLPLVPKVTVQVRNNESGLCWDAEYENNITRNDESQFKARGD